MIDEFDGPPSPTFEEVLAAIRRRRWLILLSVFLCWAAAWTIGWFWPESYESEALILVEQQKVPEQYVVPNVSLDLQDRVASMTQEVLSRTRLQSVIDRFHLYPVSHGISRLLQSRDAIEQMRRNIRIELVQSDRREGHSSGLTAFKIFYTARSPEVAQQVNKELASLFVDNNMKEQQQLSESTTVFLDNQLAAARAKLEEQEAAVRGFKTKHIGYLPSQLESNVQILSGLQNQLQSTQLALDGARQQKLYLDSLRQQYQSVQAEDLTNELANLRSKYTDDYPDIIALKAKIAKRETRLKQITNQIGVKPDNDTPSEPMMQIQSQINANQLAIRNYKEREKALEKQILTYQARLNLTPETEQQLAEISRGYEESKAEYDSLLKKQSQSELASSLEKRQQGEQLRILDPPSLTDKPSSPNHFGISLEGLVLGLIVGCGLSVLMELMDLRVRREKDLEGVVSARVLVGIPHLCQPEDDLMLRRNRWTEIGVATGILMLILVGNLYAFYKG
jgi:polysaccharide chain length determinant protein (PEP-CTERM system associated)